MMRRHLGMYRCVRINPRIGKDFHFMTQIDSPVHLAQDERLGNHWEGVQEEGDTQRRSRVRARED